MNKPKVTARLRPCRLNLFLYVFFCFGAIAQVITSTLTGFISDPAGAAVPEASVVIREAETGFTRTVTTDSHGEYLLSGIPAGNYTISVSKTGFQTVARSGQRLTQQLSLRVDFNLPVGGTQQT